ncbi:hypothetical protein ACLOJK_020279 [Asimina triloba]
MEEESPALLPAVASAAHVSLAYFSPSKSHSPRRIWSRFAPPSGPIISSPRQLTRLSLQGRLIGAQEATSATAVGRGLSSEEAVAWELFSPMQRVLMVAVVAAASADSEKNRHIFQLRRSVELRDQVLSSMQQKLDDLCEQMNTMKDWTESGGKLLLENSVNEFGMEGEKDTSEKESSRVEMFKILPLSGNEQEERRMSDLSDWCSSVTSSSEIQLNTLAVEQDIYNLRRECEEKDATITELTDIARASNIAGSKRISELEDIIKRKNLIISKLKKDMMVLEQKRPSFSMSDSTHLRLPVMQQNLLYDMDSSTSPSSSDSDCPVRDRGRRGSDMRENQNFPCQDDLFAAKTQMVHAEKAPASFSTPQNVHLKRRPTSPLRERSMNQRDDAATAMRPTNSAHATAESKKNRRRPQSFSKDSAQQKRWVKPLFQHVALVIFVNSP